METDRELELLRTRVAHLESLVERLTGGPRAAAPAREASAAVTESPGLDRRRMLRNGLGLSAAAVAGVGMIDAVGSSAAAADGDAVKVGQTVSPTSVASAPTRIVATGSDVHAGAVFRVDNSAGAAPGRDPDMSAAIVASYLGKETPDDFIAGAAIVALTDMHIAIQAESTSGWALQATTVNGTAGIFKSVNGAALVAYGDTAAIDAHSTGPALTAKSEDDFGVTASGVAGVVGNGHKDKDGGGGWGVAGGGPTGVYANGTEIGVSATCDSGLAVKAASVSGTGLDVRGATGIHAAGDSIGIDADCDSGVALKATSNTGVGVSAQSGSGYGIYATSDLETAVVGTSGAAEGVKGTSKWAAGVHGASTTGPAVLAASETGFGVDATSTSGTGLRATSTSGHALDAVSAQSVGASFQGGAAAIRLVPHSIAGHPTTGHHNRGELVVDSTGVLWLCTKAGTPGKWRQLAFV